MPDPIVNLAGAAEILGITEDQLLLTRAKGLRPGSLGFKQGGRLVFKRADLVATEKEHAAMTVKELKAELAKLGFEPPSRATKAELVAFLEAELA